MALKKNAATVNTAAAFEGEDVTNPATEAVTAEAVESAAPATAHAPAVAAASTAIAKAATTSVAPSVAKAKEFKAQLDGMRGEFDFSFGNFRQFKGSNGNVSETGAGKTTSLGPWVEVQMLGWDDSYRVSPGVDGAKGKDFVAFSKDGQVIDSVVGEELRQFVGRSVSDYVGYLKETEGFDKASCARYIDIACLVLNAAKKTDLIGEGVQVTLSQSSIPAFQKYQQQLAMQARAAEMGIGNAKLPEDPFRFFFVAEVAKKGTNEWTKLGIQSNKPSDD